MLMNIVAAAYAKAILHEIPAKDLVVDVIDRTPGGRATGNENAVAGNPRKRRRSDDDSNSRPLCEWLKPTHLYKLNTCSLCSHEHSYIHAALTLTEVSSRAEDPTMPPTKHHKPNTEDTYTESSTGKLQVISAYKMLFR